MITLSANVAGNWKRLRNGFVTPYGNGSVVGPIVLVAAGIDSFVVDVGGCTDTIFVTVNAVPSITLPTADTTVCQGASLNFAASAAGNWFRRRAGVTTPLGAGLSLTAVPFTVAGIDTIIVAGAGCEDSIFVTVNAVPVIALPTADTAICAGESVVFRANNPGTWTSYIGGTITPLGAGLQIGPITLNTIGIDTIVVDAGGCPDTILVTVTNAPNIAGLDTVNGGQVNVPYTSPVAATWTLLSSGGSSLSGTGTSVLVTFYNPSVLSQDTLIAQSAGGCRDTFIVVILPQSCTAFAGNVNSNGILCQGENAVVYLDSYGGNTIQWQDSVAGVWSNVTVGFGVNSQVYFSPPQTADTYYRAIVGDGLCFDTSATFQVVVTHRPTLGIATSAQTICENTSATLSVASFSAGIQWQQSQDGFLWSDVTSGTGFTTATFTTAPLTLSTFYRAKAFTPCDTIFGNAVLITVSAPPAGSFASAPANICLGTRTNPLGATVTSGTGLWTSTGFGGFTDASDPNTVYVPDSADAGQTIQLIWTVRSPGCTDLVLTQPLTILPIAIGTFNTILDPICGGDTSQPLGATVMNGTGRWATNGGGFFLNPNDPNTRYVSDSLADGGRNLDVFWIVGSATCGEDTLVRNLVVGFTPAGAFNTVLSPVCINGVSQPLGATVSRGVGIWTTSGSGFFTNATDPNARYIANEASGDTLDISWVVISGDCSPAIYVQKLVVQDSSAGSFTAIIPDICAGGATPPLGAVVTSGKGFWTSNGAGRFVPSDTLANAQYLADTSDGGKTITLTWNVQNGVCPAVSYSSSVVVKSTRIGGSFDTPPPPVCIDDFTAPLGATATFGTGQWSTPDGSGYFFNTADGNTRYQPGATDVNQPITLRWTVNNAGCASLVFEQLLTVAPQASGVFPGLLAPVCNTDITPLFTAVAVTGTGRWETDGLGTFVPNNTAQLVQYRPSIADANDTLNIYWIVETGACKADTSVQKLVVGESPLGSFNTVLSPICAGSPSQPLNANIVRGTANWSVTNCFGTFSDVNSPTAFYNSVPADANHTCFITLRISSPGCADTVMNRTLSVINTIVAGTFDNPPGDICEGDTTVPLGATVTSGVGGWETNGSGFFLNPNDPNTRYVSGPTDPGNTVRLTWRVTNGICNALRISQDITVFRKPAGQILTGKSATCFPTPTDTNRAVALVGTGRWEHTGTGSINANDPNAVYFPGFGDVGDTITLFWITTNGPCVADTQSVLVSFDAPPAGNFNQLLTPVCAGSPTNPLGAQTITGVGEWFTPNGSGFFSNVFDPQARYTSDLADAGDTIFLYWIVRSGPNCTPDSNFRRLVVRSVEIDGDFSTPLSAICDGEFSQPLGATVTKGIGNWIVRSGNGFFVDPTDANTRYISFNDGGDTVEICWTIIDTLGTCARREICQKFFVYTPPLGSFPGILTPICEGDTTDTLVATITNGTGSWSCANCSGSFTNILLPVTQYISASADAGKVLQIQWNVAQPNCDTAKYVRNLSVFATSLGSFSTAPDTICAGEKSIQLGATATNGFGRWDCQNCQGGFSGGTFNPNAQYISSIQDSGQNVNLLWIVQNGPCDSVAYQQNLHVLKPSLGNFNTALPNICEGTPSRPLGAQAFNGTGTWSTQGGSGTFTNLNNPNAQYIAGPGDGDTIVFLVWTVTNGTCQPEVYSRIQRVDRPPTGSFSVSDDNDSICLGNSTFSLGASASIGTGRWSTPNGQGNFNNPLDPNTFYTSAPADANKWIRLDWTVSNGTCAPIVYRDSIFVVSGQVANAGNDITICLGDTLQLQASGGGTYFWDPDPTLSAINIPNPVARPTVTTDYYITVTNSLGSGLQCVSRDTIRVIVQVGLPLTPPAPFEICQGDSVVLSVNGAVGDYSWTPDSTLVNPTSATPTAKPSRNTVYTVRARTANGCYSTTQVTVSVLEFPQPVIPPGDLCQESAYVIPITNADECAESYWFSGSVAEVTNIGPPYGPSHPLFLSASDTILLSTGTLTSTTVSYSCFNATTGCLGFTERTFPIFEVPVATFEVDRPTVPFSDPVVNFSTNSTDTSLLYYWEFSDPASGDSNVVVNVANPTHTFRGGPGTYTVFLFVQNQVGCADLLVGSNAVTVLPEDFYFPTAFTPGGDNLNDNFRPLPADGTARIMLFEIYDRWGNKVYEGTSPEGWDGNDPNGNAHDPGLYTYRCIINLDTRGPKLYTGAVTLIR